MMSALQVEHAIAVVLAIIAGPIGANGRPGLTARLLSASEIQMDGIGASFKPEDKIEIDHFKMAVKDQLGATEFDKAWAEGRALSLEQALAMALADDAPA